MSSQRSFPWSPRTLFAPMEGISHGPMRDLMASRGGVGIVCTEFVRVTSSKMGARTVEKHVIKSNHAALSVQVMGNDIRQMAEATALMSDAGADIIDINLGCPAPRVVRKGVGSAMLKDLQLLGQVLAAMRKATHLPFSAKIRAGFDDASGVMDVARTVVDAGVDFITVHPRRRVDFYQGVADWRIIKLLAQELPIPVVGNGDVWYAADALRMRMETGCAAVMIGRPALRNPWIFSQIAQLEAGQRPFRPRGIDVLSYVKAMTEMWGKMYPGKALLGLLKEQARYLLRALDPARELQHHGLRTQTMAELMDFLERSFGDVDEESLDLGAHGGAWEISGSALAETRS